MLRGKVEGEMVLLSEGSSVKESPEDKQASVPCVRGSTFTWGAHIFCKIRAGARIFRGSQNILLHRCGDFNQPPHF